MSDFESFDQTAQRLAEVIDSILVENRFENRCHDRRVELIKHHVKRAISIGFKAGIGRAAKRVEADDR